MQDYGDRICLCPFILNGRIVQIGGIGLSYEPLVANAYLVLHKFVPYNELVNRICDCIEINVNEYRIMLLSIGLLLQEACNSSG